MMLTFFTYCNAINCENKFILLSLLSNVLYECTKTFQQIIKHLYMCWTKNKIHLIFIGKELVDTSKRFPT